MAANTKKLSVGLISLIVLTAAAMLAYLPNSSSEFLLDDHILIENNPFIRQLASPADYLAQEDGILDRDDWDIDYHTRYYRPLINLTYHIDYRLWGLNPTGFHFTNWLFHLVTALLLFQIIVRLTGNGWGALVAALLFVLHPVQTESVSWIASRNNILTTLFSLAAFLCYISAPKGRYWVYLFLSACFYGLAVFSKEFGVMLLPIFFLYDHIFKTRPRLPNKSWLVYIPFVLVLFVYLLFRSQVTGTLLDIPDQTPFWLRLLMAPYLVMYNFRLVLVPVGLHNFLVTYPLVQMTLAIAVGGLGMVLTGSLLWRFRHEKYIVFGVMSFLCGLFPVLNLIPTSAVTLVAMRWLYFPLAFLSFAFCRMVGDRPGRYRIGLLLVVVVGLGAYSFYLNHQHWHDDKRFFTREVLKFNNHLYAGAYARILHESGQSGSAEYYYRLGIDSFPSQVENYLDYSAMLVDVNRLHQALALIERCLGLEMSKENRGIAYNNQGMALFHLGRYHAAVTAFEKAMAHAPDRADIKSHLGSAYGMISEYGKSVEVLKAGLLLEPESIGIRSNLANSYLKMGEYHQVVQLLEEISRTELKKHPAVEKLLRQARSRISE